MLVDVIQKCVILSASIADLYGGSAARDLYAAQPFSGGSVSQQQQHYYQTGASLSSAGPAGAAANNSNNPAALNTAYHNNGAHADNGTMQQQQQHQQAGSKLIRASGESGSSNDNGQINDNGSAVGQSASSLLASRSANEAAAQTSSSSSSPSTGQPASSNAPQSTLPSQVSRIVFQSQCTQTWSSSPSATSSPATQRTAIRNPHSLYATQLSSAQQSAWRFSTLPAPSWFFPFRSAPSLKTWPGAQDLHHHHYLFSASRKSIKIGDRRRYLFIHVSVCLQWGAPPPSEPEGGESNRIRSCRIGLQTKELSGPNLQFSEESEPARSSALGGAWPRKKPQMLP